MGQQAQKALEQTMIDNNLTKKAPPNQVILTDDMILIQGVRRD